MFFALVALPMGAGLVKAAAKVRRARKRQKAWQQDARALQRQHKDLPQRRLCTMHLMLTKDEAEQFENSPAGEFLAERTISDEAAALLQERLA